MNANAMDLVYEHRKTGGTIWQGGFRAVEDLIRGHNPHRISVVALMADDFQPALPGRIVAVRGPIRDNPKPDLDEFAHMAAVADAVSDRLAGRLLAGETVLSSCAMGWNRSGLVTALTILKTNPRAVPGAAIRLVRKARGAWALGNPAFVKIVNSLLRDAGEGVA